MDKEAILAQIEELLEVENGTYSLDTAISEIKEWDSLAYINFIAFADAKYNKVLFGQDIRNCKKIRDLIALLD